MLRKRSGKREIFKMNTPVLILNKFGRLSLLKCLGGNGGKVCKSCRCRQEFSHECLLAKFGFATPRTSLSSLEVISFNYSFGYLLSNTGFFNVARRGSDSEGNLWSQDHSQPLSAEQDLLSSNHKIRGSYYGMCPEFLFTLSKLMSLLSEVDDPSTIDPNVIQWHAWQDMLLWVHACKFGATKNVLVDDTATFHSD